MADSQSEIRLILSGENAGAVSAIESVGKTLSDFSKVFTDMATRIAESGTFIREAITGTSQSISENRTMFSGLSRSASNLESKMRSLSTTMEEMTGVSRSMQESDAQIVDGLRTVADSINTANSQMNNLRDNMNRGVDKIGGLIAVQMLGQSMEHIGQLGEHLFDYAIQQGSDFQQSMKNIQVVLALNTTANESWNSKMQDSVKLTDQLQALALQLGSRGAQSATEVAAGIDTMLRSGVTAQAVLGGAIQAAQNVAIVTGDSLNESSQLITEIFHQFRDEFSSNGKSMQQNMIETGNVITGTLLSARIDTTSFLDTLKYSGPILSQLGSGLDDAATAAALLAMNGIKGSQAGTSLRRVMTNLLEPTKSGASAMEQLGLIVNGQNQLIDQQTGKMLNLTQIQEKLSEATRGLTDAQKAQFAHAVFGQYSLAGSLVLLNANSDAYGKLKEKIDSINSSNASASMLDTFSGHMKQLGAHVATAAKEFGMAFIPILERLIPIGNAVLNFFQRLSPQVKTVLMGVLAVGSAFMLAGGALATFAVSARFAGEGLTAIKALFGIRQEVSLLGTAFSALTGPWGLLIAGIVAGVVLLITHWNQVVKFVQQNFGISIPNILHGLLDVFKAVWNGIRDAVVAVWNFVGPTIMNGIKAVSDWWKSHWDEMKSILLVIFNVIKTAVSIALIPTFLAISAALGVLSHVWKDIWNVILNVLKLVWDDIATTIKLAWHIISGIIGIALDLLSGNWRKAWQDLRDMCINVWNDLRDGVSKIVNDLKNIVLSVIKGMVDGVLGFFDGLVKGAETIWNKIKGIFGQPIQGPTVTGINMAGGGSGPRIPAHASGGWVMHPELALIGEKEPELIIPKSKLQDANYLSQLSAPAPLQTGRFGGSSSVGGRVVNINGPINIVTQAKDARGIASELKKQLNMAL